MKNHLPRLCVGLLTFLVGLLVAVSLEVRHRPHACAAPAAAVAPAAAASPSIRPMTGHFIEGYDVMPAEDRAVMTAEKFVRRNGYTRLPPDRGNLSYETVERAGGVEGMLLHRFDTLEPDAYGFVYGGGRNGKGGYTVVFRYTNRMGDFSEEVGRAVTMDEDFQNLRVEHKDFFLEKVDKRVR
ncbi:MAG TPA: hypothetical protein VF521_15170 [Pyrinomonadaceae bacterium]|jgi:hypothetical protein